MKKLYAKIKSLTGGMAMDKVLHVLCSILVCVLVASILTKCGLNNDMVIYLSAAISLAAGVIKEIADRFIGGESSMQDFLADFIGVAIGILFVSLLIL